MPNNTKACRFFVTHRHSNKAMIASTASLPVTGEPGLIISKVKPDFKCFKGDPKLSQKRLIHNVFEDGDCYFSSGDLLVFDSEYNVYFRDRLGDTFR